ncbi:MAG: serine hydrolase domain-containing protein [Acidobacteriota bacterium]
MSKRRIPGWLVLLLVPVGLILLIPGLWVAVSLTETPLYPTPEAVASVAKSAPRPQWADPVQQARQIARASVAEQNLPGLSVAVGIDGGIVWAEGFGFADLKTSTPVTPDHQFNIGTASTALTSAATGLLLENGRFKLDSEIQTYVPTFPKKEWPVTLRQVMGNTAGILPDGNDLGSLSSLHCERPVEVLRYYAEDSLMYEPGTGYRYSNNGWNMVSAAIEAAADQPFLKFMQQRVFEPLGMHDTIPDPTTKEVDEDFPLANMVRELIHDPEATRGSASDSNRKPGSTKQPAENRVTTYFPRFNADPNRGRHVMRPLDYSCYAGASVFQSTPSDLVRFAMGINSGKLLKPATVELLQTPQVLISGEQTAYGLGWDLKTVTLAGKPTRMIGHDGYAPLIWPHSDAGMVASLMTFPEYGIVVAVTSNIYYSDTSSIGMKIAQAFAQNRPVR